jgi:hypothetical protein
VTDLDLWLSLEDVNVSNDGGKRIEQLFFKKVDFPCLCFKAVEMHQTAEEKRAGRARVTFSPALLTKQDSNAAPTMWLSSYDSRTQLSG